MKQLTAGFIIYVEVKIDRLTILLWKKYCSWSAVCLCIEIMTKGNQYMHDVLKHFICNKEIIYEKFIMIN